MFTYVGFWRGGILLHKWCHGSQLHPAFVALLNWIRLLFNVFTSRCGEILDLQLNTTIKKGLNGRLVFIITNAVHITVISLDIALKTTLVPALLLGALHDQVGGFATQNLASLH